MKWTRERILETDWSEKSWAETIRACYEHDKELNEAGIFEDRFEDDSPACQKAWSYDPYDNNSRYCPLSGENGGRCDAKTCCNGLWLKYDLDRTPENAEAMTEYIRRVAEKLEAEEMKSAKKTRKEK